MFLIRPVAYEDFPQMQELAAASGSGLSLPKESHTLKILIQESLIAFKKEILWPGPEVYLFVLEEVETGRIVGCCGIRAKTGGYIPMYLYRIVDVVRVSPITKQRTVITRLHPEHIHDGPSELCSLYLLPQFRHSGLGVLLSLSRFLFIRRFRKRFEKRLTALMRPHIGASGEVPFWDAIGKPFFQMDFPTVSHLRYAQPRLLERLLPKYPIYASLLPDSVHATIGKVHPNTQPAVAMLEREGFRKTDLVDALDGGPMMEARCTQIRALRQQKQAKLHSIAEPPPGSEICILGNERVAFRACLAPIVCHGGKEVSIAAQTAKLLKIEVGQPIAYLPLPTS